MARARSTAARLTPPNTLFYGDNLDVLRRHIADESVDLVYLDPPFNSNRDYNMLFKERDGSQAAAQIKAFDDTWEWNPIAEAAYLDIVEEGGPVSLALQAFRTLLGTNDMLAYLAMMAPRLIKLRRTLKSTGSLYLHCDPTASHYLKMLLDAIFGPANFRGEIVWQRTNARSTTGRWPRLHDIVLFYSKGDQFKFNPVLVDAAPAKMPHTLITGPDGLKYQTFELTGAGTTQGETGKPWRGFDPNTLGRHWGNLPKTMDAWDEQGLIHWPKKDGGWPRRRAAEPFVAADRKVLVGDVWTDIDRINQTAKERVGYPTQKPEALLERIIEASSDPGDMVLDPFCGCGTAVVVAERLGRRWQGIDVTHLAVTTMKNRLEGAAYDVIGEPASVPDAELLAVDDPYQFQFWALGLVGARPAEEKKGADKGIDGRLFFHDEGPSGRTKQLILSVKAGKLHAQYVRDLRGVLEREKAEIAVLISMQAPTQLMRTEATAAGFYESPWDGERYPRLQIVTVAELLDGRGIAYPAKKAGSNVTFPKAPRNRASYGEAASLFPSSATA